MDEETKSGSIVLGMGIVEIMGVRGEKWGVRSKK